MLSETRLDSVIHTNGLRMTRQRQVILDVLRSSNDHLDAEAIHDQVRARNPRIGLATVYRTLGLLKELGFAAENDLGEGHGHFEAIQEVPHYHFTCSQCHQVIEFEAPQLISLLETSLVGLGIQLSSVNLTLDGLCSQCSSGKDAKDETLALQ